MNKTTDGVKRMLKEQYEKACNAYLVELARMWEWDLKSHGFWNGDEVGSIYHYGESYNICMDDIIYCVDNDITSDEYFVHTEYCLRCSEFNIRPLSLKEWHEGAPRIPDEALDRLENLKRNLEDEIEKLKKCFNYGKQVSRILPHPPEGAREEETVRY